MVSLKHIQSFIYASDAKDLTEAAERLGITQPALSKQLMLLEESFQYKLFTYKGKRKSLTPFGKRLYLELKDKVLSLDSSIKKVCHSYGIPEESQVSLGARSEVISRLAGDLNFVGRLDFQNLSHDQIIESLLKGKLDLGITHSAPDTHELVSKKIFKERFHLVRPKKFSLNSLQTLPCLKYKEDDPILRKFSSQLSLDYDKLITKRTYSNYVVLSRMIEKGIGWSVLPKHIQVNLKRCSIQNLKTKDALGKDFMLIYRKETSQAQWFKQLLQEIKTIFAG